VISLGNVSKRYGGVAALSGVTLALGPGGGVVALLGRNGAGKSTLLSIMAGLMVESTGTVGLDGRWLGPVRRDLRRATTLLPQDLQVDPQSSTRAFVRHLLRLRGADPAAAEATLAAVDLTGLAQRRLATLSGGERQRVGLAYALATRSPVLLLDEPSQGLDPWQRLKLAQLLAHEAYDRTVVVATHIVSDVEAAATRVIVLDNGSIVFDGTPEALRSTAPIIFSLECDAQAAEDLREKGQITAMARTGADRYRIRLSHPAPPADAVPVAPTVTDAYLCLTAATLS
jgi:ABC-2 type transport system ATP-binding protein